MLKTFRENFKRLKWTLWVVIAVLVIFVFADWGMGSAARGGGEDLAATVGSHKILQSEFLRLYDQREKEYRRMFGSNFNPAFLRGVPEQVLGQMIDEHLLQEEARKLGLTVSDAEVSASILSSKDQEGKFLFLRDGVFIGETKYRQMLTRARLTPERFESGERDRLLRQKLQRLYTEMTFVGNEEVEEDFATRTVKAKISYALLPASPVALDAVSDAEAEAAFRKNPDAYVLPERRKAKYLLVETAKVQAGVTVTDAEVMAEFNKNQDSYRKGEEIHARQILYKVDASVPNSDAAAKARAESALSRLRGGADFAKLATAESEDPGSRLSGGDVGTVGRGRLPREVEDAAFAAAPNALVGPVKSPVGYWVIQVLEKIEARPVPFFEVSGQIRARLQEQRAAEETRRIARSLFDRINQAGKATDDLLRQLSKGSPNVTFNETEFVTRTDPPAGVGANPEFSQKLFSLKPDEISEPVTTSRGEALVKLSDSKLPGQPAFAEVKARVVADLVKKKQDEATVAAAKKEMGPGVLIDQVAQKLGLKVETSESFSRTGPVGSLGSPRPLLDAIFLAEPGSPAGPVFLPDRGAVVFQVLERNPFDRATFDAQKAQIRERLKGQKSARLIQSLILRRRAETKTVRNTQFLARFQTPSS